MSDLPRDDRLTVGPSQEPGHAPDSGPIGHLNRAVAVLSVLAVHGDQVVARVTVRPSHLWWRSGSLSGLGPDSGLTDEAESVLMRADVPPPATESVG